jgi:tetratricopeptide (TPR) repeat protein
MAVNPNLSDAWRQRGWISVLLGQHERAIEHFHFAMRLNPLDPQIHLVEGALAHANFFLHRFEVALSWATKSMARRKNYLTAVRFALVSYAMLDRIADAHLMLARLREAGFPSTISHYRKWTAQQRQEDIELYAEACRIAGMPE